MHGQTVKWWGEIHKAPPKGATTHCDGELESKVERTEQPIDTMKMNNPSESHFKCSHLCRFLLGALTILLLCSASTTLAQTQITFGETKINQGLIVSQQRVYTLVADVGQKVTLQMSYVNGDFSPTFDLVSPSGNLLSTVTGGRFGSAMLQRYAITEAGSYSIVCRASGGADTGTYNLTAVAISGANPADSDGGSVLAGQTKSGSLVASDLDVFHFEGNVGQKVTVQMSYVNGDFSPSFNLLSPNGKVLKSVNGGRFGSGLLQLMELPESGTYSIECLAAGGTDNGSYSLTLISFPGGNPADNQGGVIAAGQTRSASLVPSDLDVFTFEGSSGQKATIQMSYVNGDFSPNFKLISPAGAVLTGATGGRFGTALLQLFALPENGTYSIVCAAANATDSGGYNINLLVFGAPENRAPSFSEESIGSATVGELTTFKRVLSAKDPDLGQGLFYTLVSGPTGLTLDDLTHTLIWVPTEAQGPGSYPVSISVRDNGTPALSATNTFAITVTEVNEAPILAVGGDETIDELRPWKRSFNAADGDLPVNSLIYSLISGPEGMEIDVVNRTLTWTPKEDQGPGSYQVKVSANDGTASDVETFTLAVREVNQAPALSEVTATPNPALLGQTVRISLAAVDADTPSQSLTYGISGLPESRTGQFTWTAAGDGPVTLVASVSDGIATTQRSLTITVINNTPPTISQTPDQETDLNQPTSWHPFEIGDRETALEKLAVRVQSSNKVLVPDENIILFTEDAGHRDVAVIPAINQSGRAVIQVIVTDEGGLSATNQFALVVCPGGPIITTQPKDQVAEPGMKVRFTVEATGIGLTFQWFKGQVQLPGQIGSILELDGVTGDAVGEYHVEVSDGLCRTTSISASLRLLPEVDVELYSVVTVRGIVGRSYQIEFRESADPASSWNPLAVLKMEKDSQLFIDLSSPRTVRRFYRVVPATLP